MKTALDRVTSLLREVDTTNKTAATKKAMDDPGFVGGKSHHESSLPESEAGEQAAKEGEQTAANSATLKEQTPDSVDSSKAVTPANAPKDTDQQPGNATPTGEDPANERDFKGDKDDSKTSHPANGSVGGKYAHVTRESLAAMSDAELYKLASDLGNTVVADVATGLFTPAAPQTKAAAVAAPVANKSGVTPNQAAAAGYAAAEKLAADAKHADYVLGIRKQAMDDADRVAAFVIDRQRKLAEEVGDPSGKAAEGEKHEAAESPAQEAAEEGGAPMSGGGEAAMTAMGGPGGAGELGNNGMGVAGPAPAEMGSMPPEELLQQLLMALQESGIDLSQLAGAGGPGPELAKQASAFRRSGRFQFRETKTATERSVRDYLKRYTNELVYRSAR